MPDGSNVVVSEYIVAIPQHDDEVGVDTPAGQSVKLKFVTDPERGGVVLDLFDLACWAIERGYLDDDVFRECGRTACGRPAW
jgi:hypothetical protein